MTDATVTIAGRLTADPILRQTPSGYAVANFTVAHTPRRRVQGTDQWEDAGETLFLRVSVWRELGENAAATLHKGDAVVVTGRLSVRGWKNEAGEDRTDVICDADSVAADLRWATAVITRRSASAASNSDAWSPVAAVSSAA